LKLIRLPLPFFPVCRRVTLDRDLRPNLRIFCVEFQQLFQPWLGIRLNRIDRTFRYTTICPAITELVLVGLVGLLVVLRIQPF
jgi:hypothetical protein